MNIPEKVSLKCLFCGLVLDVDEKIVENIKSGDQVKCNHCNESNDFDSMVKVAEEEILKLTEKAIKESLGKFF
jgi:DNA-directed RNA polymerase subunit RPC12/RpoP